MFLERLLRAEEAVKKLTGYSGPIEWKFFIHADFETPSAARIAKITGRVPEEVAGIIKEALVASGFRAETERFFVNAFLNPEDILNWIDSFSFPQLLAGRRVVIDYSSPNIAKPFSVGHLRSTVIGDSLRRLFLAFGAEVTGVNFVGDWGTQFGKLLVAYDLWSTKKAEELTIGDMFHLYVRFHKEAEKNPGLEEKARLYFKKLEEGDERLLRLWKIFKERSMKEFDRLYKYLGILPLIYFGESLFREKALEVIEELLQKGIAEISEGAVVVKFDDLPPLVLRKKDGTTLYASRDIAAAIERVKRFAAELCLYVVGNEQKLHFQQIFRVLKLLGVPAEFEHISFGLVTLPEGKMSTRKGRVVFLEDVIKEAESRVSKIAEEREMGLTKEDLRRIVSGALKFADLKNYRVKDVKFTWDILNFEGDTGPYLQYTAVRAKRVLEKFGPGEKPEKIQETWSKLAKLLAVTDFFAYKALKDRRPDIIAAHLLALAKEYSRLYERVRFAENPDLLWLNSKFYIIMEKSLWLLGIEIPARM